MGKQTGITWTDHTFNPFWGCVKVSDGCKHCYAETLSKRFSHDIWGPATTTHRRTFGDKHWDEPLVWNRDAEKIGKRSRVFSASMADIFETHPDLPEQRVRLWTLIEKTPWLDWQLLTKRPENIHDMIPAHWLDDWPTNVWMGTSVENQEMADKRIPELLKIPAKIRFLSIEPMLGPVDLYLSDEFPDNDGCYEDARHNLHWVIIGGESGPKARPMQTEWVHSLRDQCQAAGVPFFFKQWGDASPARDPEAHHGGDLLDGKQWHEFPENRSNNHG